MSTSSYDTFQKRRLQSSYVSVVVSIALVLFMTGVLGLVLLKSNQVANHFKEEVVMSLFLKDSVTKEQTEAFRKDLLERAYTKKLSYIDKDKAAKAYSKDLGEDFLQFLGDNPLKNGVDLYVKAEYVTPEKMAEIAKSFDKNQYISEVSYDKPLVSLLTKNIQRISFWLFLISAFFAVIAIILINSSIRLSIYSKRFNIKTMQMVGATKGFIRKPFIWRSIRLGMVGAILALVGLVTTIYYVDKYVPSLQLLKDYTSIGYVTGGILLISIFITWLSTFFATQRFLNLQTNELYY